ncbi:Peptidoglycan/xylan/chitin deacetylase, PgdA/CDA1 family [Variovorax sp. PDC80]|uniref:polysaccharide deacetylase family protein n=1 Tax=Variovorax sp. PDC80 TaxID=1882827 RepID=UPI0008EB25AD|nr:polysaccharide deacetylase family protein [Variovorax sp. PDC80]SFP28582.1 Peptidoglycan/xylan/chitin deacetylase, PgdA/CDA1 family [Variovorax sp. PDC80]
MSEAVRDFIGYGRARPDFEWPGGRRVALSVVVNYEEGAENCVLEGDTFSEVLNSDVSGATARAGRRNLVVESHYEYGSRAGHWRILDLLAECRVPATYFAVSGALEKHPEAARSIVEAGHEVVSHGARWIDYDEVPEATERAHMARSLDVLERLCGERPVGWYTGRVSPRTRALAVEQGLQYDSDAYNDDLPYWTRVGDKPHLVLPYSFDCNDMRFASAPGFDTPDDFTDHLRRTLACLRREGRRQASMMSIGLHLRLAGRPGRAEALREFLLAASEFPDVWFCRRRDIAQFWRHRFPATP